MLELLTYGSLTLGLFAIFMAWTKLVDVWKFRSSAERCKGTVLRVVPDEKNSGKGYPTVEFTRVDLTRGTATERFDEPGLHALTEGQQVPVLYNPEYARSARIDGAGLYRRITIPAAIGIVFLIISGIAASAG